MDFAFTEKEEAFRLEVRSWLEANLPSGWLDGTYKKPETEGGTLRVFKRLAT